MGRIGFTELVIIAIVVLLVFGPKKLPDLARALGKAWREFRKAITEINQEEQGTTKADKKTDDTESTQHK